MKTSAMTPLILLLAASLAAPLAAQAQTPAGPPPGQGRPQHGPGPGPGFGGMQGEGRQMQHPGMQGAGGPMHMRGMDQGEGHGPSPLLHGLKLSEAQQDKVFAIMHAQAPQMRDLHKAAAKAHEELRAMVIAGQFDENKAAALAKAAGQAMSSAALLHARTDAQLLALLTPEQREQVSKRGAPQMRQHP